MNSIWGTHRKLAARLTMPLLLALALAACGGDNTVSTQPAGNKPPAAAFTLIPAEGAVPLEVSVDAGGSTDPDGRITSYAWEFGDGTKDTGATATHTYTETGKHTVTLTVTDDEGATDQRQATVTVTAPPANQAPTAAFTVTPETGAAPLDVELDASASSDPDGSITAYAWDFGDGAGGEGVAVSHTYGESGEYTITLTVADDKGATAEQQATVRVTAAGAENRAPLAEFTFTPAGGEAPLTVEFTAAASYDPDGAITQYAWEFGDGASGSSGSSSVARHSYVEAGDFTVTLTVTDDRGATGQHARQVRVLPARGENRPPVAAFYVSPEEGGEAPLTVEVDASPSEDPDGWINQYAWDFGDGASATGLGAFHTFTTPGEHTITLTVTDNEGASASSSQSVTALEPAPKNLPPVASFTLTPDSGFVPLEVAFDASTSSDPDGSIVAYAWDFGDGATGSGVQVTHTYTEAWRHTATLTVTDDEGATASYSTDVTAQPKLNLAPVAEISATALSGLPGLTVTFDGSGSYDPDGTIERYEWHIGGRWDYTGPVITHTFEETGDYGVFLTVYDDKGYSGGASVNVLIYPGDYNLPPNAQFTATPNHGQAPLIVEFDASASFDHDGSIVAYDWAFGDGATGEGVSVTHTYEAAGEYTVTLTVTDDARDTANRHSVISVGPVPVGWELNPLFTYGVVTADDMRLGPATAALNLWAGGGIYGNSSELAPGFWAQTSHGPCYLESGTCSVGAPHPEPPLPAFPQVRDSIIENLAIRFGVSNTDDLCALGTSGHGYVPSGTKLVCAGYGESVTLAGTYPEIVVIGVEGTQIYIEGQIGSETGHSVIIGGEIHPPSSGTIIGDVTVLTSGRIRSSMELLPNAAGARPLFISSDDIQLASNGPVIHALIWSAGEVRLNGGREFVGSVVGGRLRINSSLLRAMSLPEAIDSPYLPKVPIY